MSNIKAFGEWLYETGVLDIDAPDQDAECAKLEKFSEKRLSVLAKGFEEHRGFTYEDGVAVPTESVQQLLHKAVNTIGCCEGDVDWSHFTFDLPSENMFAGQHDEYNNVLFTLVIGGEPATWRQLSPSEKLCGKVAGIARDIKNGLYVFEDYITWYLYELHIESTMYKETRVEYVRAENKREAMKIALGKYHCDTSITCVDETF